VGGQKRPAESLWSVGPLSDGAYPLLVHCATIKRRLVMAKRTNRVVWGLVTILASVLLLALLTAAVHFLVPFIRAVRELE
jgi:hypothetical protein